MKTKDIVCGKKYKHAHHPGHVYLGCLNKVTGKKELVIIQSSDIDGYWVGNIVYKGNRRFWKYFSPIA